MRELTLLLCKHSAVDEDTAKHTTIFSAIDARVLDARTPLREYLSEQLRSSVDFPRVLEVSVYAHVLHVP